MDAKFCPKTSRLCANARDLSKACETALQEAIELWRRVTLANFMIVGTPRPTSDNITALDPLNSISDVGSCLFLCASIEKKT